MTGTIRCSGAITDLKRDVFGTVKNIYKDVVVHHLEIKHKKILENWHEFYIYDRLPFLWFFTRRIMIRRYTIHPLFTRVEWAQSIAEWDQRF